MDDKLNRWIVYLQGIINTTEYQLMFEGRFLLNNPDISKNDMHEIRGEQLYVALKY